MKKIPLLAFLCAILVSCGGVGSLTVDVDIATLDGRTDVPIQSNFSYTFSKFINPDTIKASSFFFVLTPPAAMTTSSKAPFDPAICNFENALPSDTGCVNVFTCKLYPDNQLNTSTNYTICMTTDIQFNDGEAFEGFMASFTTSSLPIF